MTDYVLGSSEAEFERLERQAAFLSGLTRDVLASAGVAPGMRVLDIGCGAGDVSLAASAIVGPTGSVLGVDRDPEAVARAGRRVAHAGVGNASFRVADLSGDLPEGPFDAVVGRLVLMYSPDPAALLRRLRTLLVPGGILAFQEVDLPSARAVPPVPVFDEALARLVAVFSRGGADPRMGVGLDRAFRDAGLDPTMSGACRMDGHGEGFCPTWIAQIIRSSVPAMVALGIATDEEIGIDDLEDRIREGARRSRALLVGPLMIGAWARVPA